MISPAESNHAAHLPPAGARRQGSGSLPRLAQGVEYLHQADQLQIL